MENFVHQLLSGGQISEGKVKNQLLGEVVEISSGYQLHLMIYSNDDVDRELIDRDDRESIEMKIAMMRTILLNNNDLIHSVWF